MNKGFLITYLFLIGLYILNIVIVAIHGAEIVSNIMGWVTCIILVVGILFFEKAHNKTLEASYNLIKYYADLLEEKEKEEQGE